MRLFGLSARAGRATGTAGSGAYPAGVPAGVIAHLRAADADSGDVIEAALARLCASVAYDAGVAFGVTGWTDAIIELESDGGTRTFVGLAGGSSPAPWRLQRHSAGLVSHLRACLDDVDPGTGFDIWSRSADVLLCRWPTRALGLRGGLPGGVLGG